MLINCTTFSYYATKQPWPLTSELKQEAHGPHRSPEKTVQINKHTLIKRRKKNIIDFRRIYCRFFIWTNLNPFHPRCFVPSLVEIGSVVLEKKIISISSIYFHYFVIISPWKRAGPIFWTNLNPLHPRMLCAKFGWNWLCGSGEEDFLIMLMYFHYF